ncbi:10872_t:CDS:2 [Gigaspora rosea]|nr:10872_t:CDS:2 [Gigaspora rosea]
MWFVWSGPGSVPKKSGLEPVHALVRTDLTLAALAREQNYNLDPSLPIFNWSNSKPKTHLPPIG